MLEDLKEFNPNDWNFPGDRIWLHLPPSEMIWKTCTFIPIIFFGLYGNFIVIYLIARSRALRTPTNFIIANMAIADFLTLLICPAMFMINDFYQNYQLGTVGCKSEGFLMVLFLITGVLNLSVLSYDRLMAIILPTKARLTIKWSKLVIICSWLAGILFALPLALYRTYIVRLWKNFTETYCKENKTIMPKYWYVLITLMVWMPLSIMVICYTTIFYKLDRYEKRVLRREHPLMVNYKKSVAKTLFIVVIVFIALRLPFTIVVVMREKFYLNDGSVNSGLKLFWYMSQYLMFLNAAVNPVIYGYRNDNFRRAYAQITFSYNCNKQTIKSKSEIQHQCNYDFFLRKNKCQPKMFISTTNCITNSSKATQPAAECITLFTSKYINNGNEVNLVNFNNIDPGFI